ncbi:hypothetical protein B4065_1971 [Caldibacillus thermoamylovorans]|nr:hypothetical protein B4065_1971 [Caldibacillus thermoamylovorans]
MVQLAGSGDEEPSLLEVSLYFDTDWGLACRVNMFHYDTLSSIRTEQ